MSSISAKIDQTCNKLFQESDSKIKSGRERKAADSPRRNKSELQTDRKRVTTRTSGSACQRSPVDGTHRIEGLLRELYGVNGHSM